MKRLYLLFFAAMFFLPLPACALSGGALEGVVLEEGTNKPIPEAIVIARWSGTAFSFVESPSVCVHVLTTTTDAEGKYRFPAWRKESPLKGVRDVHPIITAHKPGHAEYRSPGYVRTEEFKQNIRYLKPFAGGREERLKVIRTASVSCESAGESKKNLLPLYRTLYEEARALAVTKEDKTIVNNFLHEIDLVELPYEDVLKRDDERYKALRKEFPNE